MKKSYANLKYAGKQNMQKYSHKTVLGQKRLHTATKVKTSFSYPFFVDNFLYFLNQHPMFVFWYRYWICGIKIFFSYGLKKTFKTSFLKFCSHQRPTTTKLLKSSYPKIIYIVNFLTAPFLLLSRNCFKSVHKCSFAIKNSNLLNIFLYVMTDFIFTSHWFSYGCVNFIFVRAASSYAA